MRIDLHVHSRFSKRPSQWVLQKIGCPESFTEPLRIYKTALELGMTHVTITDHNTIEGALTIAHLPNTFVSEEITTYFPEDGCKFHVLAYHITEKRHADIQKVRPNIYDLIAYLNQEQILHVAAHPLYAINERLTLWHVERILLLFKNLELNGARHSRENRCLRRVVRRLTQERFLELADRHNLSPMGPEPWRKRLFGGSDDHSSLNIARTFTEITNVHAATDLTPNLAAEAIHVSSQSATPRTMAHNLYGIAYQYYRDKFNLQRYVRKDELLRFLDRSLRQSDGPRPAGLFSKLTFFLNYRKFRDGHVSVSESLVDLLRRETQKLLHDDPALLSGVAAGVDDRFEMENRWFDFVNKVSNTAIRRFCDHLIGHLSGANVFNLFQTLGSAGGVYTLMAPYFVAFSEYSRDRRLSQAISRRLGSVPKTSDPEGQPNVVHFTDTFYEVNGVALTLRQQVQSALRAKKKLTVVTCHDTRQERCFGIRNFRPIGTYALPEYEEQKIFYPPFLEMLDYVFRNEFTHIHTATPGPVGLAALAIARLLRLPISGTYHTSIPQYAQILTGDEAIEALSWKYVLWYYDQLDIIYAPSESTRRELMEKGIHGDKIRLYPRGIDIERFNPEKRNGVFQKKYQLSEGIKLLYVGRVSREKNLHLLVDAFRSLSRRHPNTHLVVVGDGPYLEEMKREAADLPCRFTGYLDGEDLAAVYASSHVFVFPSTTDTFGNVVLEAQASGLPVVVTDKGGPCENMQDGETGIVVPADDREGLLDALDQLLSNPTRIGAMGHAARSYAEARSFDTAFSRQWEFYESDNGGREQKAA